MRNLSRTKRQPFLSLAVVLSSFIVLTGYALPVSPKDGTPAPHSPVSASMDNMVSAQRGRAGLANYHINPEPKMKTSTATDNKNKKKQMEKVTWHTPPTRQVLFHQPVVDQQSLPGFSVQYIQAPWRHGVAYSLEWSKSPQFLDQTMVTTQEDRPSASGPQGTDMKRSLLMDIHLLPLDPAGSSELLLGRVPVDSLWAKVQVRSDIPQGWYRLEVHFWDEDPSRFDHRPSTKYPEKSEVWDLSSSNLVLSLGIPKPITSKSPRARKIGVWRGDEAIEVTAFGPKGWDESIDTTSQEARQELQPQQLAAFERTHFPQESFRFQEAMSAMSTRDMGCGFSEEELEEMEDVEAEQRQSLAEHKPSWDLVKQQLEVLTAVWGEPSAESMDDGGVDQDKSCSDLDIHIRRSGETVTPDESATWRSNCNRAVSWCVTETMAKQHVLMAVELIQAPWLSGAGLARTRAELIQESLQQPRLAVLTDRIPGSWGGTVVTMPSWVLPGTYQVRLKGVSRQGVQWAEVSQPFAVQSDPYVYSS